MMSSLIWHVSNHHAPCRKYSKQEKEHVLRKDGHRLLQREHVHVNSVQGNPTKAIHVLYYDQYTHPRISKKKTPSKQTPRCMDIAKALGIYIFKTNLLINQHIYDEINTADDPVFSANVGHHHCCVVHAPFLVTLHAIHCPDLQKAVRG